MYPILLVFCIILLYGHQRRHPNFYLPFIVFQIPLLVVSLLITTYSEFYVMFFGTDELKEKIVFTLFSIGTAFLDIVQLYGTYIIYSSYRWLKADIVRQQRMTRIENIDSEMSVYP
ncbi:hypothetical protein M3Y97_00163000 [Aphelenchoides bicaudatus]|nr:hypothetical protein M3Y97_00163000 [Aphelenchoides bicaudatus]